jgi:hypothetical protein
MEKPLTYKYINMIRQWFLFIKEALLWQNKGALATSFLTSPSIQS